MVVHTDQRALRALPDTYDDLPPPPPGYRYTMDGRLVPFLETRLPIDTVEAQAVYCTILQITGSKRAAADAVGHASVVRIEKQLALDPIFHENTQVALDRHREAIYAAAHSRATVGYLVPVIGGKNKDEIVAYERRYSDTLLALLLKRHFPEFAAAATPKLTVNNTQNNVNLSTPDLSKLSREQRDRIRAALKESKGPPVSQDVIEIVDESSPQPLELTEGDPVLKSS